MIKLSSLGEQTVQNKTLPYNGKVISQNSLVFSFTSFDRKHKLFNLGNDLTKPQPVSGAWFLARLDTLKEVCSKTISELKCAPFKLHPVDWKNANIPKSEHGVQIEYWQFRLSKSKGRVVGFMLPTDDTTSKVFYIVWLDAHHNLSGSGGMVKQTI